MQTQFYPTSQNRVLAGYARPWSSKKKPDSKGYAKYDWVEDEQNQWRWNSTHENWLTKPESENEIGSIHAIQGMDLDYIGVVIANDLIYSDGKVIGVKENYYDENGTPGIVESGHQRNSYLF